MVPLITVSSPALYVLEEVFVEPLKRNVMLLAALIEARSDQPDDVWVI
jgi:hypothetical protein